MLSGFGWWPQSGSNLSATTMSRWCLPGRADNAIRKRSDRSRWRHFGPRREPKCMVERVHKLPEYRVGVVVIVGGVGPVLKRRAAR